MTPVSIVKIVASAFVFIAAGSAALVLSVSHVQDEEKLVADAVTATTAPEAAPAVRSDPPPTATETPPARAATQAPTVAAPEAIASIAAELAGPSEAAGKDQSSPSFDIARVEAGGDTVIAGRAAPGAIIDLLRGGARLDRAVADSSGQFVMVPPHLPAGSYELTLSAKLPDGTVTLSKHGVAVTVNDAGLSGRAAQSRAEYVPETASQPRPSLEPRLRKSAGLQPAHAIHASKASPAVAHAISSKVVSRGDSLWRISRITYGDGARYALVYRANRNRIRDPNRIYPGQTLVLPVKRN
jgi:nucleoid-associated protein YgaU